MKTSMLGFLIALSSSSYCVLSSHGHGMMESPPTWQSSGGEYGIFESKPQDILHDEGGIFFWFDNNTFIPEENVELGYVIPLNMQTGFNAQNTTLRSLLTILPGRA